MMTKDMTKDMTKKIAGKETHNTLLSLTPTSMPNKNHLSLIVYCA